jgi:tRNA dimethylallyltransferase
MSATDHTPLAHSVPKPVVVLIGPTAVGKSQIAIHIAKTLGLEVLSADSRQVYRGMDIGMDKPTLDERSGVPHRLIDLVDPDQPFNVGEYRRHAMIEIERLHHDGRVPLVVGGTGLYVRALLRGLWDGPQADWKFRQRLQDEARDNSPQWLHERLQEVDPDSAMRLHPRDQAKIIRALEVHHILKRPLSELHRRHAFADSPFTSLIIGLLRDRESLYRRINARVEIQLAKGLVEETRRLLSRGYGRTLGSMKGLGYRQIAGFLAGEYSYDEAVRQLKRDTRHFAKRQLTWFRKEPGIEWIAIDENESLEKVALRVERQIRDFLSGQIRTGSAKNPAPRELIRAGSIE